MRFYTDTELGPRQALLPSGALLCSNVTIARTGTQSYHPSEIGLAGDGMIGVQRDAEQVFDPRAMASFEGAPITMQHPITDVGPSNWRAHAVGHVQNVRRVGDRLVADLLVHDQRAIDAIREGGWRGVSCGYDARYETRAGGARQVNIVGNHIALLPPDQAPRCGSVCSIGDSMVGIMRRTTRDQRLSGNPGESGDLAGRPGNIGAQESIGKVGGQLVARPPGGISDYYLSAIPDAEETCRTAHAVPKGTRFSSQITANSCDCICGIPMRSSPKFMVSWRQSHCGVSG